ncbi:hypothetical protein D3C80_2030320 [compost metagenome]
MGAADEGKIAGERAPAGYRRETRQDRIAGYSALGTAELHRHHSQVGYGLADQREQRNLRF